MRRIKILIVEDPDEYVMGNVEDDINSALSKYFSNWDFTVTVEDD